jgi:hypothetical protein
MRCVGVAVLSTLVLFASALGLPSQDNPKRAIPCKTPENAQTCYWTHGRLRAGNGTPSFRLWKIGTDRILGIYSGPSVDRENSPDNEGPEFPANLMRKFKPGKNQVFADFEVCPLERERPGEMQAACVESAKNIVVEK